MANLKPAACPTYCPEVFKKILLPPKYEVILLVWNFPRSGGSWIHPAACPQHTCRTTLHPPHETSSKGNKNLFPCRCKKRRLLYTPTWLPSPDLLRPPPQAKTIHSQRISEKWREAPQHTHLAALSRPCTAGIAAEARALAQLHCLQVCVRQHHTAAATTTTTTAAAAQPAIASACAIRGGPKREGILMRQHAADLQS
eukprot:535817-Pelagomonas_calceolata.AAC.1